MQGILGSKEQTLIILMPQQCSGPETAKPSNRLWFDFVVSAYYRGHGGPPSLLEDRLSVNEYTEGQRSDEPPQHAHRIHTQKLHRPGEQPAETRRPSAYRLSAWALDFTLEAKEEASPAVLPGKAQSRTGVSLTSPEAVSPFCNQEDSLCVHHNARGVLAVMLPQGVRRGTAACLLHQGQRAPWGPLGAPVSALHKQPPCWQDALYRARYRRPVDLDDAFRP